MQPMNFAFVILAVSSLSLVAMQSDDSASTSYDTTADVPTSDSSDDSSSVAQAFESSQIVPDVIDSPPSEDLGVSYTSGVSASLGNELTPTQVKDQPSVYFQGDADSFYTLIFVDPDNYDGSDPVYREWCHWLVANIPGGDVSEGEALAEYISSGPAEGSGLHRYVFILYKQPEKLEFNEQRLNNTSVEGRDGFSTKVFAEKYNLGAPLAGNFYRAQYDDYVPQLYASLGISA